MTEEEEDRARTLLPIRCELATPTTQWDRSWRLARQRGLSPVLSTFLFKLLHRILPTGERVHKIKPTSSQFCNLCGGDQLRMCETLTHSLVYCVGSKGIFTMLQSAIEQYIPGITPLQILTLDYEVSPSLELPVTWVTAATLSSLWAQRKDGVVSLARLRGEIEEGCLLLQEGKLFNDYTLVSQIITAMNI